MVLKEKRGPIDLFSQVTPPIDERCCYKLIIECATIRNLND